MPFAIGRNQNGHQQYFAGWVDEVEISNVARSSNWVRNAWLNIASNAYICDYGQVQASPGSGQALLKLSAGAGQQGGTVFFDSVPGWIYRLQYRDSLGTGAWQTFNGGSLTSVVFGTTALVDTNASAQRFYRVMAEPR